MTRLLAPLILVAISAPALAGEPILVPDFTPGSTSEFALSFMLQEKVIEQLSNDGHIVLTTEVVRPVVGNQLDACDDVSWCPQSSLLQLPARVGIVVRVQREVDRDNGLFAYVKFFEQGDSSPMDRKEYLVTPGREMEFARALSQDIFDLLSLLGPVPANNLVEAVRLIEGSRGGTTAPPPLDPIDLDEPFEPIEDLDEPVSVAPVKKPTQKKVDYANAPLEDLLAGTDLKPKHLLGSEQTWRKAEMDPRDWMYKAMPHAGRVIVEVRGGIGLGDVNRHADVRVDLGDDGDVADQWFQEGPVDGKAVRGSLFVGYAPVTFMDFGAVVGLQYGRKGLTTGWTQNGEGGASSAGDDVAAVQLFAQPRLRFYLAPTGPVKPYLAVGGDVRLFDHYEIISPASLTYPEPPGGYTVGPAGAAGLLVDPSPIVGFFAEGAYVRHFGIRAAAAEQGKAPADRPTPPRGTQQTIAVVGGVQFRI